MFICPYRFDVGNVTKVCIEESLSSPSDIMLCVGE